MTNTSVTASYRTEFPHGPINAVTAVCMAVQMAASLPLDSLIVYSILASAELRKNAANLIVVSHALAEIQMVLSWGLLNGFYILIDQNETVCRFAAFFADISFDAMGASVALLSLERYSAMFHLDWSRDFFTTRKTFGLIGTIWLILIASCLPMLFVDRYYESAYGSIHLCYPSDKHFSTWMPFYFLLKDTVVLYGVSYAITAYCNVRIFKRLGKHQADMSHALHGSTSVSTESFRAIQKLLLSYCATPALTFPGVAYTYFLPDGMDMPWVGRASAVILFMQLVSCFFVIAWIKPIRREVYKNVMRIRANICCRSDVSVDVVVSIAGTSRQPARSGSTVPVVAVRGTSKATMTA